MAHCYVFGEGGTGMRILLAIYVMLSSLAYRKNSPGEIWKMICDEGREPEVRCRSRKNNSRIGVVGGREH